MTLLKKISLHHKKNVPNVYDKKLIKRLITICSIRMIASLFYYQFDPIKTVVF